MCQVIAYQRLKIIVSWKSGCSCLGEVVVYERFQYKLRQRIFLVFWGGGCTGRFNCIQVPLKREVNSGRYIPKRKHWGIYLVLFTYPEGDSCFSIYQISWIKMKKVTFCKLRTPLSRNFIYNLQTFRGFCQVLLNDFVANSAWK